MNNPNPFVPQGSLLEQQNKRRSRIKVGVFCVLAVGIVGLTAMLIQGCKREQTETENPPSLETNETAMNTNLPPAVEASNPPVQLPPAMTPPPVAPSVTEVAATEYVVVKGDSFSKIAKKFGVSVKAIEAVNTGVEPTKLKVGQKLSIPASSGGAAASAAESILTPAGSSTGEETYTVKSGDTLTKIAKAHGTTVKAIESENNLSTTKIKVGQKLKIPAKAEVAAPAPVPAPVAPAPAPVSPQGTTPAPAGQ
jgi:LysM repeat protein